MNKRQPSGSENSLRKSDCFFFFSGLSLKMLQLLKIILQRGPLECEQVEVSRSDQRFPFKFNLRLNILGKKLQIVFSHLLNLFFRLSLVLETR